MGANAAERMADPLAERRATPGPGRMTRRGRGVGGRGYPPPLEQSRGPARVSSRRKAMRLLRVTYALPRASGTAPPQIQDGRAPGDPFRIPFALLRIVLLRPLSFLAFAKITPKLELIAQRKDRNKTSL